MPIASSTRRNRTLTGVACLTAVLAGCGTAPDRAAPPPAQVPAAPPAARGAAVAAALPERAERAELNGRAAASERELAAQRRVEAAQRWGLAAVPLRAPAAPRSKPELAAGPGVKRSAGLPPVVYRVPTDDRVVFLTVDDGAEKDPEFSRMAAELEVPMSAFLSDYLVRSDYDYFRRLNRQGVAIENHTINHPDLRRLDDTRQQQEICGQQDRIEHQIGTRPRLFRPPYGEYTEASLRIAAGCGIGAVPLWNEEVFPDRLEYRYGDQKLHPGDIVLTHFRGPEDWKGSMPDMLRRIVNAATAQGFAIARLEDYL